MNPRRRSTDVIVVGAGAAGLTCATVAASRGARVVLIDKLGNTGGTLWVSNGTFATANSRLTALAATGDDPQQHLADAARIGHSGNNLDLLRTVVDNSGPTLDWLLDLGLRLESPTPRIAHEFEPMNLPRTYDAVNGGRGYLAVLRPAVAEQVNRGRIRLLLRTRLTSLVRERGTTAGVRVVGPDGVQQTLSSAFVVLAAGGYGANRTMVQRFNPGYEQGMTSCPPHADGSVIVAAAEAGCGLIHMDWLQSNASALPNPRRAWWPTGQRLLVMMRPPFIKGAIWIDTQGQRVLNEDSHSPSQKAALSASLTDKRLILLFDSRVRSTTASPPIIGLHGLNKRPPQMAWTWSDLDRAADTRDSRQAASGNSLGELAEKLALDAAGLCATVERWNRDAQTGTDSLFGRQITHELVTPPYYGIVVRVSIPLTMGGVAVNGWGQALDDSGQPINGLYVIGETVGMGQVMGNGLVSGLGNTSALVMGKVVAERITPAS